MKVSIVIPRDNEASGAAIPCGSLPDSDPDFVRKRTRLPVIAHTAVCLILGGVFLWLAAWEVAPASDFSLGRPAHSTDYYLSALIGREEGTEFLSQVFAKLPEKAPIAVIFEEENSSAGCVSFLVSYLAWPREVRLVPVRPASYRRQWQALDRADLSAVVFCGVEPPPVPGATLRLGDGMTMVSRDAIPH